MGMTTDAQLREIIEAAERDAAPNTTHIGSYVRADIVNRDKEPPKPTKPVALWEAALKRLYPDPKRIDKAVWHKCRSWVEGTGERPAYGERMLVEAIDRCADKGLGSGMIGWVLAELAKKEAQEAVKGSTTRQRAAESQRRAITGPCEATDAVVSEQRAALWADIDRIPDELFKKLQTQVYEKSPWLADGEISIPHRRRLVSCLEIRRLAASQPTSSLNAFDPPALDRRHRDNNGRDGTFA